jgi:cytoskeletal protein CcmA (bactofilin family)
VVFRRDSKVDAFQRQISALRQQLGGDADHYSPQVDDQTSRSESRYRTSLPELGEFRVDLPRVERHQDYRDLDTLSERTPALEMPLDPPAIDTHTSVIAHTTVWNGNLESSGSLHIHGRVDGTITARDDIFVADEAEVDAVVSAANVTISGSVRGSIICSNRFEVLPRGRVSGDVRAPTIVIHDGAMVAGEISMSSQSERAAQPSARIARGGD